MSILKRESKSTNDDLCNLIDNINTNERMTTNDDTASSSINIDGEDVHSNNLGWCAGVACPVTLSMFSTLLFLRTGYIVGNSGWLGGVLLLLIAYSILGITVLSISAIATNGEVKSGGVYFMISRTMGFEFGASIGVLFFLANVVASALYGTGFAEGVIGGFGPDGYVKSDLFDGGYLTHTLASSSVNIVNLIICLIGAKAFGRFTLIMLVLVLSCIVFVSTTFLLPNETVTTFNTTTPLCVENCTYSIVNGSFQGIFFSNYNDTKQRLMDNLWFDNTQDCENVQMIVSFSTVFSVLFSGVTGILAGANLSGELQDPSKDIPFGTNVALSLTFIVYTVLFVLTGATCDRIMLFNDCQFMSSLSSLSEYFVFIATLVCCWCASCSCLIGASRILNAVSIDVGGYMTHISNFKFQGSSNPVGSVLLTFLLIQMFLFIGSLNKISQLCCVFFLMSYFGVNFACFCLDWAAIPNFRPTFKMFHWSTALCGMSITFILMFFINVAYAALSWLLCLILVLIFTFSVGKDSSDTDNESKHNWGSISQAIIFHQVRKYLLHLDPRRDHVKYWRPHVLLLISHPNESQSIMRFGNDLKKGGVYLLGHVYKNNIDVNETSVDHRDDDPTVKGHKLWYELIKSLKIKAFSQLTIARDRDDEGVFTGITHILRLSGIGCVRANTVLLGFPSQRQSPPPSLTSQQYTSIIGDIVALKKSICIFRNFDTHKNNDDDSSLVRSINSRFLLRPLFLSNRKFEFIDIYLIDFIKFVKSNNFCNIDEITGLFMLQLGFILTRTKNHCHCRVRTIIGESSQLPIAQTWIETARIESDVEILSKCDENRNELNNVDVNELNSLIRQFSKQSKVSLMYFNPKWILSSSNEDSTIDSTFDFLNKLTVEVSNLLFVHGSHHVVVSQF